MSLATQISSLANRIAAEFKTVRTDIAGKASTSTGTTFPTNPVAGQMFVNTTTKCTYIYNGSAWDELSRPNAVEPLLLIGI